MPVGVTVYVGVGDGDGDGDGEGLASMAAGNSLGTGIFEQLVRLTEVIAEVMNQRTINTEQIGLDIGLFSQKFTVSEIINSKIALEIQKKSAGFIALQVALSRLATTVARYLKPIRL